MNLRYLLFILGLLSLGIVEGQEQININELREQYRSFNYEKVISLSNIILSDTLEMADKDLIELFTMRAVAFYSLNNPDSAVNSFNRLLALSEKHKLNPVEISPKIIELFEETRSNFLSAQKNIPEEKTSVKDSTEQINKIIYSSDTDMLRSSVIRSIILPGWGHLYAGDKVKGWTLSIVSLLNLGTLIYFIVDANDKEQKYLVETEKHLIQERFDDFNRSYKFRNISAITFLAVWIYTQLDLLFFSDIFKSENLKPVLNSNISPQYQKNFTLSLKYYF